MLLKSDRWIVLLLPYIVLSARDITNFLKYLSCFCTCFFAALILAIVVIAFAFDVAIALSDVVLGDVVVAAFAVCLLMLLRILLMLLCCVNFRP